MQIKVPQSLSLIVLLSQNKIPSLSVVFAVSLPDLTVGLFCSIKKIINKSSKKNLRNDCKTVSKLNFTKKKTYFQGRNTFLSALNISCWQNDVTCSIQILSTSTVSFGYELLNIYSATEGQILCHFNQMHIVQHLSACLLQKISLIPVIDAMSLLYFTIPLNGIINEETGKSHVCFFMHL